MTQTAVVETAVEKLSGKELVHYYNELAPRVQKAPVTKFTNLETGRRRLTQLYLEVEALTPKTEVINAVSEPILTTSVDSTVAEKTPVKKAKTVAKEVKSEISRKKRQKIFRYPPGEVLKAMAPGSLRAQARDLLLKGATFAQVEDLIREFDEGRGKAPNHRIAERAYGLVRLLHTYIGYGLREEGESEDKTIFIMTPESWKAQRNGNGK